MRTALILGLMLGLWPAVAPTRAHAAVAVPAHMQGIYTQHAGSITIRPNGRVTMTYQAYERADGLPSFPRLVMTVTKADGNTLTGRVVRERRSPVDAGARFTITKRAPGMRVYVEGADRLFAFCDAARRAAGRCGA